MTDKVLEAVASNGVWAILFFFLLMYQLAENKRREERYLKTIDKLSGKLDLLEEMDVKLDGVRLKLEKMLESNIKLCAKAKAVK